MKETILDLSQGTVKILWTLSYDLATGCSTISFFLIQYQYKMSQYNTLNVKLTNSQLNKLKSGIKK